MTVRATVEGLDAFARIPISRDPPAVRFHAISAGSEHTCAVVSGGGIPDGTAYCWGNGMFGQLGNGTTDNWGVPRRVLGVPPLVSVDAGDNATCGVSVCGEVYCWGSNTSGQLGDGSTLSRAMLVRVPTTRRFRAVAVAGELTCGLGVDGAAYCWGRIGNTTTAPPTLVPGGIQFAELTGGGGVVCGRASGGRACCWGTPGGWIAGPAPTLVSGDVLFSQIDGGAYHVCGVVVGDGTGMCWGRIVRQLGPSLTEGVYTRPIRVPGDIRYTTIAAGSASTCGTTASGSYCLGLTRLSNEQWQDPSPRPIPKESQHPFATITGGHFRACAIDRNGGGWCWGRNLYGQVGAGELDSDAKEPLQLRIP